MKSCKKILPHFKTHFNLNKIRKLRHYFGGKNESYINVVSNSDLKLPIIQELNHDDYLTLKHYNYHSFTKNEHLCTQSIYDNFDVPKTTYETELQKRCQFLAPFNLPRPKVHDFEYLGRPSYFSCLDQSQHKSESLDLYAFGIACSVAQIALLKQDTNNLIPLTAANAGLFGLSHTSKDFPIVPMMAKNATDMAIVLDLISPTKLSLLELNLHKSALDVYLFSMDHFVASLVIPESIPLQERERWEHSVKDLTYYMRIVDSTYKIKSPNVYITHPKYVIENAITMTVSVGSDRTSNDNTGICVSCPINDDVDETIRNVFRLGFIMEQLFPFRMNPIFPDLTLSCKFEDLYVPAC